MGSIPKVPVGTATIAGYSTSLALFVLAAYAFAEGDRSEQTLGTLSAGIAGGVIFAITQIGRYVQARDLAKNVMVVEYVPEADPPGDVALTPPPAKKPRVRKRPA
jgi:hypothetical protein